MQLKRFISSTLSLSVLLLASVVPPASADKNVSKPKSPAAGKNKLPPRRDAYPDLNSLKFVRQKIKELQGEHSKKDAPKKEDAGDEGEEEGLDFWRAREYYLGSRAYMTGKIDKTALNRAREHRNAMMPARIGKGRGANAIGTLALIPALPAGALWEQTGPYNMRFNSRLYFGPQAASGRVNVTAFHPTNPKIFYAGGSKGGVWRTVDSGANWTPLTDFQNTLSISSIAIDAANPNIIFAGTGDYNGFDGEAIGLLRSKDEGRTWEVLGNGLFSDAISAVLLDPKPGSQNMLVCAGGAGVWRTTNRNAANPTFTQVFVPQPDVFDNGQFIPAGRVSNVVYNSLGLKFGGDYIDPNDGAKRAVVYCSVDNEGIYKSYDNGANWTPGPIPVGEPFTIPRTLPPFSIMNRADSEYRLDMDTSKLDPDTLYVLSDRQKAIFKSTDGGATWSDTTSNFPHDQNPDDNNFFGEWGQAFYDYYLRVSSATVRGRDLPDDVIYVGLLDVIQSADGGRTWGNVGLVSTFAALTHTDQHAISFNPRNPNDMLVGNDGGVYRYTFNAGNNSHRFNSLNTNIAITQFYNANFSPSEAGYTLGGTQDNGSPRSQNGLWDIVNGGDGGYTAINNIDETIQYAESQSSATAINIVRTNDKWQTRFGIPVTINPTDDFALFIPPIAIDPGNPNFLYTGSRRLWRYDGTTPTATAWTEVTSNNNPAVTPFPSAITAIAVSRMDSRIRYIGVGPNLFVDHPGSIWIHRPNPANPAETLYTNVSRNLPGPRYITSIAVSPSNPLKVYVTIGQTSGASHVFRNDNVLQKNWVDISGAAGLDKLPNVHANTLAIGPEDGEQILYVGTDIGVFATNNAGRAWTNATAPLGLPNADVRSLTFVPTTGYLSAATFGRGTFQIKVGNQVPFIIQPQLTDFRGDRTKLSVKVEFFNAVRPAGQPPREIKTIKLTSAGWGYVNVSVAGYYDVYVTIPGFLRKYYGRILTSNAATLTAPMVLGDVNSDNLISAADLTLVRRSLGLYVNRYQGALVDLDGDGQVTDRDVQIVIKNLGKRGN